jgi:hypothetical protein
MSNLESLKTLKSCIKNRIPVYITGPAGSGKTTVVKNIATELGLKYYSISVSNQTTVSAIFGFVDASGTYRPSLFRLAYEFGGVFLMDELDSGNANTISAINQAIENGICGFPDGKMVEAHPDFTFCSSGNTVGTGANKRYVGRNPLDGASLDRLGFIEWEYDEELELKISENHYWVKRVQAFRTIANILGVGLIISPRASKNGSKLINDGIPLSIVEKTVIFKGQVDKITQEKLIAQVNALVGSFVFPIIETIPPSIPPSIPLEVKKEVKKFNSITEKPKRQRKLTKRNIKISPEERKRRSDHMKKLHEDRKNKKLLIAV